MELLNNLNMNTKIYVVTHKAFKKSQLKLDDCYKIIAVGDKKKLFSEKEVIMDDSGENIAQKNPNYCELTAQYWYWKNDRTSDIVGLCHYRRYFTNYLFSKNPKGILKEKDIAKLLNKYDVIVPTGVFSYRGAYRAYLDCGYEKDLKVLEETILSMYPDYMLEYENYFKYCASNYPANMYIARKDISDKYSEWIFSILFEVEKKVDISKYSAQESRIFGYMSERLLSVWLHHNKYKIKEKRIINTEESTMKWNFLEVLNRMKLYQTIKKVIYQMRREK